MVTSVATSVNAVGDDASATLQTKQNERPITIGLKSYPLKAVIPSDALESGDAGKLIDKAYEKARNA